jgi:hypothetical protein
MMTKYTSWEQYNEAVDAIREREFWRAGRLSYRTDEVPAKLAHVTNDMRSAVETFSFEQCPPERYFAYVRVIEGGDRCEVITWIGQLLGRGTLGREWRDSFGGKRVPLSFVGINGRKYNGTYFKSSGDYCRVRRAK